MGAFMIHTRAYCDDDCTGWLAVTAAIEVNSNPCPCVCHRPSLS